MVNDTVKSATRSYLMGSAWYLLHDGDQTIPTEKFVVALERIDVAEATLRQAGVSEPALSQLMDRAEAFLNCPWEERTSEQKTLLLKLMFGSKVSLDPKFDLSESEYQRYRVQSLNKHERYLKRKFGIDKIVE